MSSEQAAKGSPSFSPSLGHLLPWEPPASLKDPRREEMRPQTTELSFAETEENNHMGKGPVCKLMTALLPHLLLHCGCRVRTRLGAQVSEAGFPVTHVKPQY